MNVIRHKDEGVQEISPFPAIAVESREKEPRIVLDLKDSSVLPGSRGNEISAGRRKEP
jgi:hypothetical protein